ncbi:MSHA biogenesis protein MshI [Porticoccus sp. W117]|uniref:MSHA biogenesis protein MshI n=1 Tax=Porticoccus sp. W117 TaxID=3054777 RepID=UPI00259A6390|nr:MSHA biogenesis protein MshI [Porticoccus sp. W117]MDM3870902.1 MSHA biogenesis protein MshI [Porticoccus sp. W117]
MGVEIRPDGIAVAQTGASPQGDTQLLACEFLRCDADADRAALLRDSISSLGLKGARCHAVLPADSYQLQLTEAPQVPANELRDAVRWKIQDQLSMPVEEAVIDAFPLPQNTGRSDSVYAVAAAREQVDAIAQLVSDAGLKLKSVDINELALRNLASTINTGVRSIAIALLSPGKACVNVYGNDALYLSRQFDIPWKGGLMDDLPSDSLALELQRSLDYFERQMRQPPPKQIYLCGEHVSSDKIDDDLKNSLSTPLAVLDLADTLPLPAGTECDQLPLCVAAIGASLRSEVAA